MAAIRAVVGVPVTVKCRLGVDDQDCEESLDRFVEVVGSAGPAYFVVHARRALLSGISPEANRKIPPLNYERVFRLARDHPNMHFVLNGGIKTFDDAEAVKGKVSGVMIGRAAVDDPWNSLHAIAEREGLTSGVTRKDVVHRMADYADLVLTAGGVWGQLR